MERVRTLIEKLQQQLEDQASHEDMLQTVQMLYAELNDKKPGQERSDKVFVMMPTVLSPIDSEKVKLKQVIKPNEKEIEPINIEEKVIEVLQVNEKEIEEELNEIKKNAEAINKISTQARPVLEFDPLEDIPTLAHQTALKFEEQSGDVSLNEKLNESKKEVSEKLTEAPIKDLKKAIGINDRYLYINELFRGDEAMYERSIKTINNFSIFAEAEFWIRRELKLKLGWKDDDQIVKQFDQLVRRRFS
jgi:uncharacterized protein YigA (DUF484 family)